MQSSIQNIIHKENFKKAIQDIIYLYDRDYPEKTVIQAVGNRYRLSREERAILYRGISKYTYNKIPYIIDSHKLENENIIIDGYNVLITLQSYFRGDIIFKGLDNITRDIAGTRSNKFGKELLMRSIDDLMDTLSILKVGIINILLDQQVSKSGELSAILNQRLKSKKLMGESHTVISPDYILKNSTEKIICTSDTVIISKVPKIFDLPGFIIETRYNKRIYSILE